MGILLEAYISSLDIEDLDLQCCEDCNTNGQYVEYKKLWDIEAENKEKEFHGKELERLERWNKAVLDW